MTAVLGEYEPLLTQRRLEAIEQRIRQRVSALPQEAAFVTFVQPRTFIEKDGLEVPIPDVVVFGVLVPNPRLEGQSELVHGVTTMSSWRTLNDAHRHSSIIEEDPAYQALLPVAHQAAQMYDNLAAMTQPKPIIH